MVIDTEDYSRPDAVGANQLDPDEIDMYFDDDGFNPFLPASGVKASAAASRGGVPVPGADNDADSDDGEFNDNQRRLQEIGALDEAAAGGDVDDAEDSESEDGESADEGDGIEDLDDDEVVEAALHEAESWTWSWPIEQRYEAMSRLVRLMVRRLASLREEWDDVVATARTTKAEAGAATMKKAIVVGATVVGASRRLETLRAAEPFAAVVEEACEVMEPTLISVLAVKSLQKLELVGDHRQLPAFVQQCWYNLEMTMPSIKTSMFERLIGDIQWKKAGQRGGASTAQVHRVPFSVLDEQRRMRSNLADLTRPHYTDVTAITDHPKTGTQKMGDTLTLRAGKDCETQLRDLQKHRELWHKRSSDLIPGMWTNVFFWDLPGNAESRPLAGLSACNEKEAHCVVSIAKWLILCGTPHSSITIITPYKGQKNLIIKFLREAKLLPDAKHGGAHHHHDDTAAPITVSTVDTFQGDENDVILLSLVRCRPGNRFIELLNRFIVAVSRARLGLYVVGSKDAVVKGFREGTNGPSHWVQFTEHLKSSTLTAQDPLDRTPRIGTELPVCCPRHLACNRRITDPNLLPNQANWGQFCAQPCPAKIPCGHRCAIPCHSPTQVPHTVSCLEEVDRPCEAHRLVPLLCGDVKRLKPSEPLAEAFRRFQCEVPVTYLRSCGHSVRLHCFEETKLKNKQATLNPCVENVDDFELPCGHRIVKPTCSARAAYQAAPPQCNVQVQHTRRGCGCVMKMRCFESVRELKNLALVQCDHPKEIRRPRCGHNLTSQCHRVSNLLAQWVRSNTGIAAPFPASPQTKLALQYSDRYGAAENALTALIPDCNVKVDYIARCGHPFRDLLCHQAFAHAENGERTLDMCRGDRLTACVLCATPDLHIPCWSEAESRSLTNVLRLQTLTREGNNFSVEEGEVAGFARQGEISSGIINVWKDLCTAQFTVRRRCGHALVRTCREVLMHLASTRKPREGVFAPCTVIIDRTLLCGHKVRVKCCEKDLPEPKCIERNTQVCVYPCGEHQTTPNSCAELRRLRALAAQGNLSCFFEVQVPLYRCGHTVTVKCCDAAQAKAVIPGGARLPSPQSVVTAKQIYCSPCEIVACGAPVTAQFPCGHKKDDVPCHDAFSWVADEFASAPLCCNKVGVNNPVCQHPLEAFCWTIKELRAWQPWSAGLPKVGSVQIFNAQGQATLQQVVYSNSASPKKPPACITPEMVVCTTNTTYYRSDCGHTQVVRCSDAHWQRLQPCEDQVEQVCPQVECHHKRLVMCHLSKQQLPCQNKIQKLCLTCQVNQVESACSKKDVRCNRQVEAPLCCGHIASWLCGTELDPRSRGADAVNHCLQCVLPRWSRYIDITIPTFNLRAPDCWLPLRDQINRKVDGTVKVVSTQNLVTESQFHIDSRQRIARTVLDTLHNNPRLPVEAPPVVPFMSAEELKGQSYTWVICSVNGPDQAVVDRFNTLAHTEFGLGVQLEILTDTAIQDLFRSKAGADGSDAVRCCVGVVYTRKVLTAEAPFVLGAGAKQQKIAARVVANHRSTGLYDAVQYAPRGQGGERKFITAWETGAAVPLAILTVEQMAECRVCMCPYSIMEGLVCASPKKCNTFTCWECLCRSYEAALKPGAIQGCCNKEGDLLCSEQKCRHPITVQQWSKVTPTPEVLEAQQKLKLQTSIAVAVQKELEIQKRQLEAEYARIEQIKDADEKTAAKLRLKIVNEFLTLRCPRCKAAFVDFSGCFALTCSNQACRCGFCAWCLKDCGADAHGHVPGCSEGNRDVYGTFEGFTEHHRQKRTAAVKALIRSENLSKNALAKLKELISRDLTDLRIPVNDVFPAAAVAPPAHGAPLPPQNQQAQQRGFFGFFGLAPAPPPQQQHQQLYHDAPAYNEYADYDMDDDDDEEYDW